MAISRKNWLFAGADTGAETLARTKTIIETALCRVRHKAVYAVR
jgi:transposase